jgi:hypothetical protein
LSCLLLLLPLSFAVLLSLFFLQTLLLLRMLRAGTVIRISRLTQKLISNSLCIICQNLFKLVCECFLNQFWLKTKVWLPTKNVWS